MVEKAETLFKELQEHSVAEFFKKNRQMLGYSGKIRSLTTIVHEYVTNSLDACEDAGILPELKVRVKQLGKDHYSVMVEDNGPGIPKKHLGNVFAKMLAGTKFHRFVQARGQQGIGATGCTMYAQITTGKPVKVITSTGNGKITTSEIMIDVKNNKPDIVDTKVEDGDMRGTRVTGEFKDVAYNRSEYSPIEYMRRTAVANPHARIVFIDPDKNRFVYERAVSVLPKKSNVAKPHPLGLEIDDLIDYAHRSKERTIKSFFVKTFDRMSSAKATELEEITSLDFKRTPGSISWRDAEEIVDAIKKTKFLTPNTANLVPMGEKQIEKAVLNVLQPEFHSVITRSASVYRGGVPFVVEAGIAFGGKAGRETDKGKKIEILRFANRAPLLFDAGGCAITKVINSIDWKRYELRGIDDLPVSIFVNITSTYIPYTSAGKQAISSEDAVIKELNLALMEVGRRIKGFVSRQRRDKEKKLKRSTLLKYIPETARAIGELTSKDPEQIGLKLLGLVNKKYDKHGNEKEVEE